MKYMTNTPNTVFFSQASGYMVVRTDAQQLPEFQKYLAENPNAKVTFDQMQYVRTQDSIVEVPQVTPAVQTFMWQILGEDKPVRQTFEELGRQMVSLAANVKK